MTPFIRCAAMALMVTPTFGGAQNLDAGFNAYMSGDYITALSEWRPLAKQGDAAAQFSLGVMYANGQGVPRHYVDAVKWYRLAAEQGHADAQVSLGRIFDEGRGVPQDYAEAVKWYRLAIEQGAARQQVLLGARYYTSHNVRQDYAEAVTWLSLAAELADIQSRFASALSAREALQSELAISRDTSTETSQDRAALQSRLAAALAAVQSAEAEALTRADLLASVERQLSEEKQLSAQAQRQVALLNAQVAELRAQIGTLQSLLNIAEEADREADIQIENLGTQLNTALARVAAEQSRRVALEEIERQRLIKEAERLAVESQNLERFRSEFFGQLHDVMEDIDGLRIENDRFVFSSEMLFQTGQSELSAQGRQEIGKVAGILKDIGDEIPNDIDWVIRVDGHTDDLPLSGSGQYRDNWELSQARALSVVRYMQDSLGIPPQRMAANGFGEYQPLNPAGTPEARAQNRRIELKLTER